MYDDDDCSSSSSSMDAARAWLILDLDGTLIGSYKVTTPDGGVGLVPVARPGLTPFLASAIRMFGRDRIVIWTAATREWYRHVWHHVLGPALACAGPDNAASSLELYDAVTGEQCIGMRKPLRKLWRRQQRYPGMTRDNVIHVDDNEATFAGNWGNAVRVPAFDCTRPAAPDDVVLWRLTAYLAQVLSALKCEGTVRHMDKRYWCTGGGNGGTRLPCTPSSLRFTFFSPRPDHVAPDKRDVCKTLSLLETIFCLSSAL